MKKQITSFAKTLGFDLVGFSEPKLKSKHIKTFQKWLKDKNEGQMLYMQKTIPREDPTRILPNMETVITLAINYYHEQPPLKKDHARIARYAYGRDYHKIFSKKLKQLEKFIQKLAPEAQTKSYVDTGPILERAYAEQSGLGFIGKNCCLITKEFGSWVFLSEIITTLKLAPSSPKPFGQCGTCTKCIDACPTGAILAPGVIDARRCLSFLTIENKGAIPREFHGAIRQTKRIFGCDICQEVCPHNSRAIPTTHPEFLDPKIASDQLPIQKILAIKSDAQFLRTFAGSPLMRAKRKGLQRNAKILT